MDEIYLYLSMTPEALIASMLPPVAFGIYLAVGTKKRSGGQAMYFDLKNDFQSEYFNLSSIADRCVRHSDGQPKHSVYISIYRVLEHVPLEVVNNLYLSTRDGQVLKLQQEKQPSQIEGNYYLYKEICPVHPLIASSLNPKEFCRFITDPSKPIYAPKICFAEMNLGEMAEDPENGCADNLPYHHLNHIRDCLLELNSQDKHTKTVDRIEPLEYQYRCVKSGFFLGDYNSLLYFPFPPLQELESKYHRWWRSADL
ncbi:MAG: hypothetical protein OEW48_08260 [Phycisphaerae bacterium]|nr:hypothetical protein [Phycisphaerae bacterium]